MQNCLRLFNSRKVMHFKTCMEINLPRSPEARAIRHLKPWKSLKFSLRYRSWKSERVIFNACTSLLSARFRCQRKQSKVISSNFKTILRITLNYFILSECTGNSSGNSCDLSHLVSLFHFLRTVRWNNGGCSGLICQVTILRDWEGLSETSNFLNQIPVTPSFFSSPGHKGKHSTGSFSSLAVEHLHQNGLQPAKYHGLNLVQPGISPLPITQSLPPSRWQSCHAVHWSSSPATKRKIRPGTSPQCPKTSKSGVDLVIDENICCSSLDHKELLATSTLPMSWACFASKKHSESTIN